MTEKKHIPGACIADEKDPACRIKRLEERDSHLIEQVTQCLDKREIIRHEIALLRKEHNISASPISTYPETINELVLELTDRLFEDNIRVDPAMRMVIFNDQLGTLAGHLSHDPVENPGARPRGTDTSEYAAFGHALAQLIQYGISRKIRINEGLRLALDNLREKDFRAAVPVETTALKGTVVCWKIGGLERGRVYVDPFCTNLKHMPVGDILVANHPGDDFGLHIRRCGAIITNHGGMNCHAAILAREYNFTCIVGTGNATEVLKTGDVIHIESTGEITIV